MQTEIKTPVENALQRKDRYIGDGDSYYGVITFVPGATEAQDTFGYETIGSTYDQPGQGRTYNRPTPEIEARAARAYGRIKRELLLDGIADQARTIERGKHVVVDAPRARNRPRTGEGVAFWYGNRPVYGSYGRISETRVGVKFDDGTSYFYPAIEVSVLDPEDYIDIEKLHNIERYVDYAVRNPSWDEAYSYKDKLVPPPTIADAREELIKWVEGK